MMKDDEYVQIDFLISCCVGSSKKHYVIEFIPTRDCERNKVKNDAEKVTMV